MKNGKQEQKTTMEKTRKGATFDQTLIINFVNHYESGQPSPFLSSQNQFCPQF